MSFNRFLVFLIILHCQLSGSFAQNSKPIELKKADSLVGFKDNFGKIRLFEGHVNFLQGNVEVTSDKATQFLDENKAELLGNVTVTQEDMILKAPKINWDGNTRLAHAFEGVIILDQNQRLFAERGIYSTETLIADFEKNVKASDDTVTITADRIRYNRQTRKSFAWGNVKVEDDSSVIFANYGEYDRLTRESKAYGNVLIIGKYNSSFLSGDTIYSIPERHYTFAKGNPILNQIDTIKKNKKTFELLPGNHLVEKDSSWVEFDTLSVNAKQMEQIRESTDEIFLFKDSVKISRNKFAAISNNATFYKKKGYVVLQGNPVVWYDSTQLHADSIFISMPNNKLSLIHSFGNSLAATREDTNDVSRINQIIGNEIEIKFTQDTIRGIFSYGNAKSLYFMQSKEGEDGVARNSSDTIHVDFIKGEAQNIIWLGGIQGEYFPELLITSPKEYYLPNFRWKEAKPKLILGRFLRKIESNE